GDVTAVRAQRQENEQVGRGNRLVQDFVKTRSHFMQVAQPRDFMGEKLGVILKIVALAVIDSVNALLQQVANGQKADGNDKDCHRDEQGLVGLGNFLREK